MRAARSLACKSTEKRWHASLQGHRDQRRETPLSGECVQNPPPDSDLKCGVVSRSFSLLRFNRAAEKFAKHRPHPE
jgi:hypothetical protein